MHFHLVSMSNGPRETEKQAKNRSYERREVFLPPPVQGCFFYCALNIHALASVFFTAGGLLSFFRSPVVGFGRNWVEIHRSAPLQLSKRHLVGNFGENSRKLGENNPKNGEKKSKKIYEKAALSYILNFPVVCLALSLCMNWIAAHLAPGLDLNSVFV